MKLSEKSRRILRKIYCGLGVTAVSFVFHACDDPTGQSKGNWGAYGPAPAYGPGPDYVREEVLIRGKVISKKTGEPVRGISVFINNINRDYPYLTGFLGEFFIYVPKLDNYNIVFTDIDGDENGGNFKQYILNLTIEEAEALKETPLIIELEEMSEDEE